MDIVVGISSVVVALCALCTSIWQAVQSRKHNKLSFRPHLASWTHSRSNQGTFAVDLMNNGLGPALVKSFVIKVDGNRIPGNGTEPIGKALEALFPNNRYHAEFEFLGKDHAMPAQHKCRIVAVQFLDDDNPSADRIEETFDKADLEIEYESFYGEKFFFSTNDEKSDKVHKTDS